MRRPQFTVRLRRPFTRADNAVIDEAHHDDCHPMQRRFQFNLRGLMAVVTMAAVTIWAMKRIGPFMFFAGLVCYGTPVWLFLWLHRTRHFKVSRDKSD